MKAELVPDNGDPPIRITKDLSVVGRRGYCDVVVDDTSVSKRHCVLVKTDGLLVIRDLGSTNGTKVKGQRVRWAALLPDDRISVGTYKFRVYLGPDDTPGPSDLYEMKRAKSRGGANPVDLALEPTEAAPDASLVLSRTATPASWDGEPPVNPDGLRPEDYVLANAKTPVDGQPSIVEID